MKKLGFPLIAIGLVLVAFFSRVDMLVFGKDAGIGAAQLLGIESGGILLLLGVGFLCVDWNGLEVVCRARESLKGILHSPASAWVAVTFLAEYIAYFLAPVFLSKQRMQYLNKYIPDAYITHIGFDLMTTLERVQAWLLHGQSPYDGFIIYSPAALVLLAPLMILGYPGYYRLVAVITFLSFCTIFLVSTWIVRTKNKTLLMLFFITGLFSYGFQFELERGQFNVIAFALTLSALYLFHFHHRFRYFAYALFSLAIQLKIYPAIFLLLFIKDWRDWKGNLLRVFGLGLLNFSMFFILGYKFFLAFFSGIVSYQADYRTSRYEDLSIKGFVHKLTTGGFEWAPVDSLAPLSRYAGLIEAILWLILCICLAAMLVHAYQHRNEGINLYLLPVCVIVALVVPSASVDYKLPLLAAPMAMLFMSIPGMQHAGKRILSLALSVIASGAYWSTLYPNTVKPDILASNFPALFVMMVSITLLYFLAGGKIELSLGHDSTPGNP